MLKKEFISRPEDYNRRTCVPPDASSKKNPYQFKPHPPGSMPGLTDPRFDDPYFLRKRLVKTVIYSGTADGITEKVEEDFERDNNRSKDGWNYYSKRENKEITLKYRSAEENKLEFIIKAENAMPSLWKNPDTFIKTYFVNPTLKKDINV